MHLLFLGLTLATNFLQTCLTMGGRPPSLTCSQDRNGDEAILHQYDLPLARLSAGGFLRWPATVPASVAAVSCSKARGSLDRLAIAEASS